MALDETRLLAFAKVASALPLSDIVAAAHDPTNLGKVAAAVEDIIATLPAPPLTGLAADLAIQGFVDLVYASSGGTIAPGAPADAQTSTVDGRPYVGR
jgi:hypothetical protein